MAGLTQDTPSPESLTLHSKSRVLEVGTGSGYQAAILARLCHAA